jgi:hypothetical protein
MIRCARAKSSLCYPEVFHRFCGYLDAYEKFFSFLSDDAACTLSSGRRMNFAPPSKKVLERGAETGLAVFVSHSPGEHAGCCAGGPLAKILGENAVAATHQLESRPVGPVAQWLVQGTHRQNGAFAVKAAKWTG